MVEEKKEKIEVIESDNLNAVPAIVQVGDIKIESHDLSTPEVIGFIQGMLETKPFKSYLDILKKNKIARGASYVE